MVLNNIYWSMKLSRAGVQYQNNPSVWYLSNIVTSRTILGVMAARAPEQEKMLLSSIGLILQLDRYPHPYS